MPQDLITVARIIVPIAAEKVIKKIKDEFEKTQERATANLRAADERELYDTINYLKKTDFNQDSKKIEHISREDCQAVVNWYNSHNGGYVTKIAEKVTLPDSLFYKNSQGKDESNFQRFFEHLRYKVMLSRPFVGGSH